MKSIRLIILFFLIFSPILSESQELDRSLFKSSNMVSLEVAKKEMKLVYLESGETKTDHCGCFFDKQKQVYPIICDVTPNRKRMKNEIKALKWVHVMPRSTFAASMSCWEKPICTDLDGTKFKGTDCCNGLSPKFKSMESDMHNLIPTFNWFLEAKDDSYEQALLGGMREYKMCVSGGVIPDEPDIRVRGNVARAYLYMSFQYHLNIENKLEDRLRVWHFEDPPDKAEGNRNTSIEIVQGNRNPFIDHPEIVERVRDF